MIKKYLFSLLLGLASCLLVGCKEKNSDDTIRFGLSAEYPPFEYYEKEKLTGFDVELAQLIAQELQKKAVFTDMQFSSLLPALETGSIDAAISTITITPERQQNFDFSDSYYAESLSMVYPTAQPIKDKSQLPQKKIACQLGTTMEIWLRNHAPNTTLVAMDNNNLAIEALKGGHVDGVMMDTIQASVFSQKNAGLSYSVIAQSDSGYGVALKKNSPLKDPINQAIQSLAKKGELEQLKQKWLSGNSWNP